MKGDIGEFTMFSCSTCGVCNTKHAQECMKYMICVGELTTFSCRYISMREK